jgi:hypothetical protein
MTSISVILPFTILKVSALDSRPEHPVRHGAQVGSMVKVTFLNGAKLGMDNLFNAELDGAQWRAIKYFEGDKVDAGSLKKLLRAAVAFNAEKSKR